MIISPNYKSVSALIKSILTFKDWHALRTHFLAQFDWEISRKSGKSIDSHGSIPWWSYSATHFLDQVIPKDWRVLEVGGGASTEWWYARGNQVVTIENNPTWALQLQSQFRLRTDRVKICQVSEINERSLSEILENESFDVVINDGSNDRNLVGLLLLRYLSETGLYIWDNSDRLEYQDGLRQIMERGYTPLKFFGLSPINAYSSETTILSRKLSFDMTNSIEFKTISY